MRAREKFQQAANLIDAEPRMKKSMWAQFWSAHQRFFKYLCIASKVRRVVQLAREEVQNGKVGQNINVCLPRVFHINLILRTLKHFQRTFKTENCLNIHD